MLKVTGWQGYSIQLTSNQRKSDITILISDKIDFKLSARRDEGHCISFTATRIYNN